MPLLVNIQWSWSLELVTIKAFVKSRRDDREKSYSSQVPTSDERLCLPQVPTAVLVLGSGDRPVKIQADSSISCHCIRWYFWLLLLHTIQHSSYKKLVVHCKLLTLWDKDWVSSSPLHESSSTSIPFVCSTHMGLLFLPFNKIVVTVPSLVKNQYIKGSFVSFIQKKTVSAGWVFHFVNGQQVWGFYTFQK